MSKKKYYLIKEETSFYDGHGSPNHGGSKIRVEYTSEYNDLDLSKIYSEDLEVLEDNYDEEFSESDGYNMSFTTLQIKEISSSEYEEYTEVINTYTEILYNF